MTSQLWCVSHYRCHSLPILSSRKTDKFSGMTSEFQERYYR